MSIEENLLAFKGICAGEYDALPEAAFYMVSPNSFPPKWPSSDARPDSCKMLGFIDMHHGLLLVLVQTFRAGRVC